MRTNMRRNLVEAWSLPSSTSLLLIDSILNTDLYISDILTQAFVNGNVCRSPSFRSHSRLSSRRTIPRLPLTMQHTKRDGNSGAPNEMRHTGMKKCHLIRRAPVLPACRLREHRGFFLLSVKQQNLFVIYFS